MPASDYMDNWWPVSWFLFKSFVRFGFFVVVVVVNFKKWLQKREKHLILRDLWESQGKKSLQTQFNFIQLFFLGQELIFLLLGIKSFW